MNWYKIAKLSDLLLELGVSNDISDFITNLPDKDKPFYINQVKKNPKITLPELQLLKPEIKPVIDPYLEHEHNFVNTYLTRFPELQTWYLVNSRKLRKGKMEMGKEGFEEEYERFYRIVLVHLREILDWYQNTNPKPDIASMTIDDVQNAQIQWHNTIQGQGNGINYEPTNPSLIVYGPTWKNKELQNWTIQEVRSENDLDAEGNKMKHCVGNYYKKVADGRTKIFSLRDPQNNPHVTVETDSNITNFQQFKGNANSEPKPEYKAMIKEWIQSLGGQRFSGETDTAIDDYYTNYYDTKDMVAGINDMLKGEDNYGLIRYDKNNPIDIENMIEKLISTNEKESRRSDHDYYGAITNADRPFVDLAIRNGKYAYNDPIRGLYELEKTIYGIIENNDEDLLKNYDFIYWEKQPDEDDFETKEQYNTALSKWENDRDEAESDEMDEYIGKYARYVLPNDIIQILNNMRNYNQYPKWEELVKKYEPPKYKKKLAKIMNWYKTYKIAKLSDQAIEKLNMSGFTPIEEKIFQNYELYLMKANNMAENILKEYNLPIYQLGLQRKDTEFTNISQQKQKNPSKSNIPIKDGLAWIKQTIEDWKSKYGQLMVASHFNDKTITYKAILKRLNINYIEKDFNGNNILIIQ